MSPNDIAARLAFEHKRTLKQQRRNRRTWFALALCFAAGVLIGRWL